MDLHLVFEFLGIIFSIVAAIWVYEQSVQTRFNTTWKRIDEKQKLYFDTFLKIEVYNIKHEFLEKLYSEKHTHLLEFFKEKFDTLEKKIDDLKVQINNKSNNHNKVDL